jgi:hypothetical protein
MGEKKLIQAHDHYVAPISPTYQSAQIRFRKNSGDSHVHDSFTFSAAGQLPPQGPLPRDRLVASTVHPSSD